MPSLLAWTFRVHRRVMVRKQAELRHGETHRDTCENTFKHAMTKLLLALPTGQTTGVPWQGHWFCLRLGVGRNRRMSGQRRYERIASGTKIQTENESVSAYQARNVRHHFTFGLREHSCARGCLQVFICSTPERTGRAMCTQRWFVFLSWGRFRGRTRKQTNGPKQTVALGGSSTLQGDIYQPHQMPKTKP